MVLNKVRGPALIAVEQGWSRQGRGAGRRGVRARVKTSEGRTYNKASVMHEVNPDVRLCVEAENRPTLLRFPTRCWGPDSIASSACDGDRGNDDRGIDGGDVQL